MSTARPRDLNMHGVFWALTSRFFWNLFHNVQNFRIRTFFFFALNEVGFV